MVVLTFGFSPGTDPVGPGCPPPPPSEEAPYRGEPWISNGPGEDHRRGQTLHKRYTKYHNMVLTESDVKTFLRDLDGSYSQDLTWISDDEQIDNRNK